MEYLPLDITVISADDLKNVNIFTMMDVYVVVSLSMTATTTATDSKTKRKTHIDKDGGSSPRWNHRMKFSIEESTIAQQPNLSLLFQLMSDRFFGDRDIGQVSVPIRELLDSNSSAAAAVDNNSERVVDYQVRTPSGKPKGTLKFSYKFGEKFTAQLAAKKADEPVTAYPPPPGVGYAMPPPGMAGAYPPPPGYGYPPPPPGHGYPPPPGYGYQPQPQPMAGYGYMPPQQQKKKKKGSGMGLGLGAGLLGGLLVGDMLSDAGDMGGYDDAGFDF